MDGHCVRVGRDMHACLGEAAHLKELGVVWPCVCVRVCVSMSEMPCRISPLSHEQDGHLSSSPSKFPACSCGTSDILVIETGRFFLGILARGKDGDPSRITFGRRHQKGGDHFRSVVSGYAAQPRRCRSRAEMLVLRCLRRTFYMKITPHSATGGVSSHVARMIAALLIWTLEVGSLVGAFPVLTGSLMGKLKRAARLFIIPYLLLIIGVVQNYFAIDNPVFSRRIIAH